LPFYNANTSKTYLDEFSLQNPNELKIIVLDNGVFYKAHSLLIPNNIVLILLPPCSLKLIPVEKIWAKFKRSFKNKLHKNLDEVCQFIESKVKTLHSEIVISICTFQYIFLNTIWTNN